MGISVSPPDQAKRHLRLSTPLSSGGIELIPIGMAGSEAMSTLFRYELRVSCHGKHDLQPKQLVTENVTMVLVKEDQSFRYFNGIVSELEALGRSQAGEKSEYRLTVVPALWLLEHTHDYRILQDVDIKDIIAQVLKPYAGSIHYQLHLTQPHARRRFVVQHDESDLTFLLRWLREENVAFYFTHENGKHCVHFVDAPGELEPMQPATLLLQPPTSAQTGLLSWTHGGRFVPGKAEANSYNYKSPSTSLAASASVPAAAVEVARAQEYARYRYTGGYGSAPEGSDDAARWALRGAERHRTVHGTATYHQLEVGRHFTVAHADGGDWYDNGKEFTLTALEFEVSDMDGGREPMVCRFTAVPKGTLVYPASVGWPMIHGLQTARVVGPDGEEVHTDALGRVKVRFHWDRRGNPDGAAHETTCWLRVMQSFAGPGFGAHFTPRVGQEVVVAFEGGNPDRPFVLGALYHDEHRPPYSGKPTQSGIKTRSTKGGGESNCNEIRFDDQKGSEQLYVQAEKNMDVTVKANETRTIGKKLRIQAGQEIELVVGGSVIKITGGKIEISSGVVDIDGGAVQIN